MSIKVFEYDVHWYSDNQKCMVHAEFLSTDVRSLILEISTVFSERELRNIRLIKKIRQMKKRDLSPLDRDRYYP